MRIWFIWRLYRQAVASLSLKEKVMKTFLVTTTLVAAFSIGTLTQAQELIDTLQSIPASCQQDVQSTPISGDTAYGGVAMGQSASGRTSNWTGAMSNNCAPRPFCNVYSGGQ